MSIEHHQREELADLLFQLTIAIAECRRLRAEGLPFADADGEVDRILRFARMLVAGDPPPIQRRIERSV